MNACKPARTLASVGSGCTPANSTTVNPDCSSAATNAPASPLDTMNASVTNNTRFTASRVSCGASSREAPAPTRIVAGTLNWVIIGRSDWLVSACHPERSEGSSDTNIASDGQMDVKLSAFGLGTSLRSE
jgi:hypothetical protein